MIDIRSEIMGYINEIPEERLPSALDYLRFLCETKNPLEITSKKELYRKIDEGLDDLEHGRDEPFEDTMRDLRQMVVGYEV